VASIPGLVYAQHDAGVLGTWRDQELRVRYDAPAKRTAVALTIVPGGGTARVESPLLLRFEAQFPGREATEAPSSFFVSAYAGARADARVVRPVTMHLTVDPGTEHSVTLPYFGSQWSYYGYIGAGAELPVIRFTMTATDLRAIDASHGLSGQALGYNFTLSPSQLDAVRRFARTIKAIGPG
jgi:hypothetical protein